jgi:glycosyltransferase involved in cell wall biosynthesis
MLIDDQTAQGLARWCENFATVSYAGIELPESDLTRYSSTNWVPIAGISNAERIQVFTMPNSYKIQDFFRNYKQGRARLAYEVARSQFLCFTLGALSGDWPAVAALESIKQHRKYAVWFDRVEHEVIRSDLSAMPLKRRVKEAVSLPIMQHYHRYLVRRSELGLFQGRDCYDHYSRFTNRGHCVYDTHTKKSDFIDNAILETKKADVLAGQALRIVYVGRAADMKGPFDWIEALSRLRDAGVAFTARWLGDGPLLKEMRALVAARNLMNLVELPGFVSSRESILGELKRSDVFFFCHKTPESPRCLIESLVCGCPILGYGSAYARDLAADGGGEFVNVGDIQALTDRLMTLDQDRPMLASLIAASAKSGLRFDEEKVYRHRAGLIKSIL